MKTIRLCNICGKLPAETYTKRLVIDHNHLTKMIRGWLCDLCNAYVGIYESIKMNFKKKKRSYINWFNTYHNRIIDHVYTDLGINFKDRELFRLQY